LPIWEGYDEPFHFSFIQYVAARKSLPVPTTPVSREVQQSLHLLPLSWEQRLHAMAPPIYTADSYWELSEAGRTELQRRFRAIPPACGMQQGTAPALYEAQQAPLYYWLMAFPLSLAAGWSLAARVLLLRVLSVLLASLLVPIAYIAAKKFFADGAQALGIVAVITCMPELMIDISRVANESLAIAAYSLLTLLLLLAVRPGGSKWFVIAGVVLGLGLLTKAYFLLAMPAFLMVAGHSAYRCRGERGRILFNAAAGIVGAALLSSWWYWRNHVLTGSWSGEETDVLMAHQPLAARTAAFAHVNWIGGMTSVLVSHIWFGGWSFLKLPKAIYVIFAIGMIAAVAGLLNLVSKDRLRSDGLMAMLALYGFFWIGLMYGVFVIYNATGISAVPGWYMYAVIVPELLLVTWGLYSIVPKRWQWLALPGMTAAFAAIDFYGVCALLIPYYTGIIAHLPASDIVRPAGALQLVNAGPHLLLDRLTANKAVLLVPWVLGLLFLAYCLSTAVTVVVSYAVMRGTRANGGWPTLPS
jgi:4-amino-4-deoxy-L-arabinose transferase-like glycosyltransferase